MDDRIPIYIVDDDASARDGLTRFLRASGHEVQPYASVRAFVNQRPLAEKGCLVIDARMLGNFIEERQVASSLEIDEFPIIIVAAEDDPESRLKAKSLNAAGFFLKPIDGSALQDAIVWAIGSAPNHSPYPPPSERDHLLVRLARCCRKYGQARASNPRFRQ
jgi:FixJ family two-component response regulator